MIIVGPIKYLLEGFVKGSVAVIVDGSLNVCKEIFKFTLILLMLYYFAMWSFHILNEALPENQLTLTHDNQTDVVAHEVMGETCLRIGPPDENLIKQRASLLEQLEIEAEFEEYQDKLIKSEADMEQFVKKEIHKEPSKIRDSDNDIVPFEKQFISQIKQELNETSRASQTLKTSLGKKSKLREDTDNRPSTSNMNNNALDEEELLSKFDASKVSEIKKEVVSEHEASMQNEPRTSKTKSSNKPKEERPSFDDQYDHESFYRV